MGAVPARGRTLTAGPIGWRPGCIRERQVFWSAHGLTSSSVDERVAALVVPVRAQAASSCRGELRGAATGSPPPAPRRTSLDRSCDFGRFSIPAIALRPKSRAAPRTRYRRLREPSREQFGSFPPLRCADRVPAPPPPPAVRGRRAAREAAAGPAGRLRSDVHQRGRHDDRQRRAAGHLGGPERGDRRAPVGARRLPCRARRAAATRQRAGRPLRPQASVPGRHGRLRRRLVPVRDRSLPGSR